MSALLDRIDIPPPRVLNLLLLAISHGHAWGYSACRNAQCFQDPLVVRREALTITLSTEAASENITIVQSYSHTLDERQHTGRLLHVLPLIIESLGHERTVKKADKHQQG